MNLTGKLLEFSTSRLKSRSSAFGIIQMDGVAVLGSISEKNPYYGMLVRMTDSALHVQDYRIIILRLWLLSIKIKER